MHVRREAAVRGSGLGLLWPACICCWCCWWSAVAAALLLVLLLLVRSCAHAGVATCAPTRTALQQRRSPAEHAQRQRDAGAGKGLPVRVARAKRCRVVLHQPCHLSVVRPLRLLLLRQARQARQAVRRVGRRPGLRLGARSCGQQGLAATWRSLNSGGAAHSAAVHPARGRTMPFPCCCV